MHPSDPRSLIAQRLVPLVESPMANWSWMRGQTKSDSNDPYGRVAKGTVNLTGIGVPGPHPGARPGEGARGRASSGQALACGARLMTDGTQCRVPTVLGLAGQGAQGCYIQ